MHRHVWKITDREHKPARWPPPNTKSMKMGEGAIPTYLLDRTLIVTFECEKCGTQKVETKTY